MGLNKVKSKSNMYQFIDATWNPLGGACPHKCSYCSTNKLMRYPGIKNKYTGEPRLYEKELVNLGSGNFIFVAAQNDLFADGVPSDVVVRILDHCEKFDNKYLFQTKAPQNINDNYLPKNSVVCTTIETNRWYHDIMEHCHVPWDRVKGMVEIADNIPKYLTIEPIMDFDLDEFVDMVRHINPRQVNVGADSGGNNLPEPSSGKVQELIEKISKFTIVKEKSNLKRIYHAKDNNDK